MQDLGFHSIDLTRNMCSIQRYIQRLRIFLDEGTELVLRPGSLLRSAGS